MPLFGVFGWTIIHIFLMVEFCKSCGIRLGVWALFDVKLMIVLEGFLSQIYWEIGWKALLFRCFLLLLAVLFVKGISCPPISFYSSFLHLNKILLLFLFFLKKTCVSTGISSIWWLTFCSASIWHVWLLVCLRLDYLVFLPYMDREFGIGVGCSEALE